MTEVQIGVYAVGLLHHLQMDLRMIRSWFNGNPHHGRLFCRTRGGLRRLVSQHGGHSWRCYKNYLNGYLAEPTPFPEELARCGSGWTRRRALRDLQRRMARL